jgi:large subunit ribosomal protein L18
MHPHKLKQVRRKRRRLRVRRKIDGAADRPRLAVFRSLKNLYAQIIDDSKGHTLVAASTVETDLRSQLKTGGNKSAAELVGRRLGERAAEKGIQRVVLDRRHYRYHGRIQSLADAMRKAGVEF